MSDPINFYQALDIIIDLNYYGIKEKEFNDWMTSRINQIGIIKRNNEFIPDLNIINDFVNMGYEHPGPNECHKIAKSISLLNPEYQYYTGFVLRSNYISNVNPCYFHSFNVFEDKIYDFSKLNLDNISYLPHTYYGVQIPVEYLKGNAKDVLLIDYFKDSIKV